MNHEKYLDRELLCKFQINKEVQIKLLNIQANVNYNEIQKVSLTLSSFKVAKTDKFGSTANDVNSAKRENRRFKCHLCPHSSANKCHLKQHLWTHSEHKEFKCDKCSYRTNNESHLKRHTSSKHNKNPEDIKRNYPCQLCSKRFLTISALRNHLSVHTKEKPFQCQFCSKEFTLNATKNRHEIICAQNPKTSDPSWVETQKRFQCKLCDKKFINQSNLAVHIGCHTQERPYKCDNCNYAAASNSVLKRHVNRKHNPNKIRNFACTLCQKLFFAKPDMYRHIKTHTKETLSSCEVCKKQFATESNRNLHDSICKLNPKQSDEEWVRKQKKFKCDSCTYASTRKIGLKQHIRGHKGHAPFEQCLHVQSNDAK